MTEEEVTGPKTLQGYKEDTTSNLKTMNLIVSIKWMDFFTDLNYLHSLRREITCTAHLRS